MTTTYIPKADDRDRKWFVIDAKDQVLGKLAGPRPTLLTGKRKPTYTPFLDTGDHVIVINAEQVHLTGRKEDDKLYRRHTGYMGGLKTTAAGGRAQEAPGAHRRRGRARHAAEDQAGPGDVRQAQGLRRRRRIRTRRRSRSR